jgi:hypothetical protein
MSVRIPIELIIVMVVLVMSLVLIVTFIANYISNPPGRPESYVKEQPVVKPGSYDYSSYILSDSPVDLSTYDECDKLKEAIKNAVLTGKPYMVDDIAYGSSLSGQIDFPTIGDCPASIISAQITRGLNQTVCNFETISTNSLSAIEPYGGISDSVGLSYGNCTYDYNKYAALPEFLPTNVLGPTSEPVNLGANAINVYYSPDYLYFKNGDYDHYTSFAATSSDRWDYLNNISAFQNTAENGPGRLKIFVGNATVIDGTCKFNIYFCPRPAIAKGYENKSIELFERVRKLSYTTFIRCLIT